MAMNAFEKLTERMAMALLIDWVDNEVPQVHDAAAKDALLAGKQGLIELQNYVNKKPVPTTAAPPTTTVPGGAAATPSKA